MQLGCRSKTFDQRISSAPKRRGKIHTPYYPWLHLLPDGTVFYSGSSSSSFIFDPSPLKPTFAMNVATTTSGLNRTYGNSVLLPLLPKNNYAARVMILGGGSTATAKTEIIDLLQKANPESIVFPSVGWFVVSLTVVDSAGVNDPSPPTRTISVQPDKLIVKIVSPLAKAIVKGSVAVNVSAMWTIGTSNAFRFGVDTGVPPLSTTTALNQLVTTSGTSASFTWNTTQLTNGVHTLWVSCADANGNFGGKSEVVTLAN